ncbi:polymer-forming cytoskeletal protein [Clostridium sp. CS001]|uniref:polymer-forming cytoskeletal protein n=1 Tax=Clostridium sp. CS001 TaxID=2880648 RepID=UPI001CF20A6E|nr:polymer-forming cytoskeletal protein [Clostridium sp. CS001]MCB2290228.1 polymer-forming cytoskeletal protein [Clostridium sp. CS001]
MEKNIIGDIKISGSGSSCGGKCNEVSISGSGKINGDLECVEFKTSGSSKVTGALKAETIKVSGSANIEGDIEVGEMKVSGSAHVLGQVKGQSIKISGSIHVGESLYGEEVNISGSLHVGKDCEVERFKASGNFKIQGLLNAGEVNISLGGKSSVKEIGGEHIEVKVSSIENFFLKKVIDNIFNTKGELTTELIEGDEIYLENTNAKIVRGNNVTIGDGCNIGLIEYSGEINISSESIVKEQKKI